MRTVLPLLFVLACPLLMMVMMRGHGERHDHDSASAHPTREEERIAELEREVARLRGHDVSAAR